MVFNSFQFIFFFLAAWLCARALSSHVALRNAFLLLASLIFYGLFKVEFLPLLLYVILVSHVGGLVLEKRQTKSTISIIILLSLLPLLFYKYSIFLLTNILKLPVFQGITMPSGLAELVLPVGISFFTLQALTYTIDVYRGKLPVERNVVNVALAISFFPTLLSGPITRARDLLPQLRTKLPNTFETAVCGCETFIWGLFKKSVVADRLGQYVDVLYANPQNYSGLSLAAGALAYSLQIYCDFSGYSDMAIGTAKALGFSLPDNFRFPYFATGIREFWKRWHISLTSWFTEYLYISCGGNRVSTLRWVANILLVFLVSGLWHGASWTFIIWGMLHGIFYLCEYAVGKRKQNTSCHWILHILQATISFIAVSFAWIFFRMPTLEGAWTVISRITCKLFDGKFFTTSSSFSFALMIMVVTMAIAHECHLWCQSRKNTTVEPLNFANLGWSLVLLLSVELLGVSNNQFVYFLF